MSSEDSIIVGGDTQEITGGIVEDIDDSVNREINNTQQNTGFVGSLKGKLNNITNIRNTHPIIFWFAIAIVVFILLIKVNVIPNPIDKYNQYSSPRNADDSKSDSFIEKPIKSGTDSDFDIESQVAHLRQMQEKYLESQTRRHN
jgi:hypothetical protein